MLRKSNKKILGVLVVASLSVTGQEINWHSVDQGGGVSSGSGVSITGVIGQTDAVRMEGGSLTVSGGFIPMTSDLIFENKFD